MSKFGCKKFSASYFKQILLKLSYPGAFILRHFTLNLQR